MMEKWLGVLGLIIIAAAMLLIRFPSENDQGISYSGLLVSEDVRTYPVMVKVVPQDNGTIGVALQDYEMDFGILSQGMVARKTIRLDSGSEPVKVRVWPEGNISGIVNFSPSNFVLEGPREVEIAVTAKELGYYSGNIHISSAGSNYKWLRWVNQWL
jgi:hypothetical protein